MRKMFYFLTLEQSVTRFTFLINLTQVFHTLSLSPIHSYLCLLSHVSISLDNPSWLTNVVKVRNAFLLKEKKN